MKTSQWRRAVENRCVYSACLKVLSDRSGDHCAGGRRFHVAGPLTATLRCPVAVRARGTSRVPVAADRRCWRPEMAVAGTQRSLRSAGETPWTHSQTIKAVLKTTWWLIDSQCRSSRIGMMCSLRRDFLHRLKFQKVNLRHSSQCRVAVVKLTVNKSL